MFIHQSVVSFRLYLHRLPVRTSDESVWKIVCEVKVSSNTSALARRTDNMSQEICLLNSLSSWKIGSYPLGSYRSTIKTFPSGNLLSEMLRLVQLLHSSKSTFVFPNRSMDIWTFISLMFSTISWILWLIFHIIFWLKFLNSSGIHFTVSLFNRTPSNLSGYYL